MSEVDKDFIERATLLMKPLVEQNETFIRNRINLWNENNREKLRECQRQYNLTYKGMLANRKRSLKRTRLIKRLTESLSDQEFVETMEFYDNCPEGYEVDHIIPVSKGGSHKVENLQYLTRDQNARKACKIEWKNDCF